MDRLNIDTAHAGGAVHKDRIDDAGHDGDGKGEDFSCYNSLDRHSKVDSALIEIRSPDCKESVNLQDENVIDGTDT